MGSPTPMSFEEFLDYLKKKLIEHAYAGQYIAYSGDNTMLVCDTSTDTCQTFVEWAKSVFLAASLLQLTATGRAAKIKNYGILQAHDMSCWAATAVILKNMSADESSRKYKDEDDLLRAYIGEYFPYQEVPAHRTALIELKKAYPYKCLLPEETIQAIRNTDQLFSVFSNMEGQSRSDYFDYFMKLFPPSGNTKEEKENSVLRYKRARLFMECYLRIAYPQVLLARSESLGLTSDPEQEEFFYSSIGLKYKRIPFAEFTPALLQSYLKQNPIITALHYDALRFSGKELKKKLKQHEEDMQKAQSAKFTSQKHSVSDYNVSHAVILFDYDAETDQVFLLNTLSHVYIGSYKIGKDVYPETFEVYNRQTISKGVADYGIENGPMLLVRKFSDIKEALVSNVRCLGSIILTPESFPKEFLSGSQKTSIPIIFP